jgi:uncharacterized membrane protein YfhO
VLLPLEARDSISVSNAADLKILSQRVSANRLEIEVETPQPSLLVVAQSYYHPWQARVNDRQTSIFEANYAFQALEVPGGRSRVVMEYKDRAFTAGTILCVASLLICAGIWLSAHRVRQRTGAA